MGEHQCGAEVGGRDGREREGGEEKKVMKDRDMCAEQRAAGHATEYETAEARQEEQQHDTQAKRNDER